MSLSLIDSNVSDGAGALPLVIGFTGHREFRDEDHLGIEQRIREVFQGLQEKYSSTPLILLTSVAEGADRMAARIALEMSIDYIIPLPLKPETYRTDFSTEKSNSDFDELLAKANRWFTLPIVEGSDESSVSTAGYERNLQYAQVGAYIARYSQIMIAVWDGVVVERLGGTSMVVHYKLNGIPEMFGPRQSALDPVESGPVYHIVAGRKNSDEIIGERFQVKNYYPRGYHSDTEAAAAFDRIYERLDAFNSDVLQYARKMNEEKERSAEYLFPKAEGHSLTRAMRTTIGYYTSADTLASYFQKHTFRAFIGMFVFVFSAAFFFDLYAHLFDEERIVLVGYLSSLLAAFLWYRYARRKQYQSKYLDYRALAEGLRVQFYWEYAGIRDSAADYYLRKQKSELDWIRYALRTVAIPSDDDAFTPKEKIKESKTTRLETVLKYWVEDQAKYYPRAMQRDHLKLHKLERYINLFFYLGIGLAGLQLFLEPSHYLIVSIGLTPLVAALLGGYIERNALVGHIKQYQRMGELFVHARVWLQKLLEEGKRHEAIEFIMELGKESLSENGDWMLLHRERPLEVPKG